MKDAIEKLNAKFAGATEKQLSASKQDGPPGHCIVAQVFGAKKSVATIDATINPELANAYAVLFAAAPLLKAALLKALEGIEAFYQAYLHDHMDIEHAEFLAKALTERANLDKLVEEILK